MKNPLLRAFLSALWPVQIALALALAGGAWLSAYPGYALAFLAGAGCHFFSQGLYLHYAAAAFQTSNPAQVLRVLLRARLVRIATALALFALLAAKLPQLLLAALPPYLALSLLDALCARRLFLPAAARA